MTPAEKFSATLGVLGVGLLGSGVPRAAATVYPDTAGDQFSAFTHLDITSVEITNDATNLSIQVTLAGDIVATNWGKYLVGIDSVAGGITSGNGWGKPISMSGGMDYFIGSWVDFGSGFEIYRDNAGAWVRDHATYDPVDPLAPPAVTANSLTLTFPLAYLNLTDGSAFKFDVYSSGGGGADSANDASSNPATSIMDWPQAYDSGTLVSTYTVDLPDAISATWNVNASGAWSAAGNWSGGVPNAAGAGATFGGVPQSAVTVTTDVDVRAGTVTFDNANAYTIDGPNTLTLDATTGPATVNVAGGSHTINAPVALADDTTITVTPAASTLTLTNLQPAAAATLTKGGAGTLVVNHVRGAGLTVSGGTFRVAASGGAVDGVSKIGGLTVASGARVDLTDNKLIIASPAGTWDGAAYTGTAGLVDAGRGPNATWDGSGIITSDTRAVGTSELTSIGVAKVGDVRPGVADTATTTFAGQTVLGSDTVVMYTWGGDANLDGKINIDDYGQIDSNVAKSGTVFGWSAGDFNYDGKINIDDYGIIDGNIGRQSGTFPTSGAVASAAPALDAVAAVPEPTIAPLLAALALGGLRRRRRRVANLNL